MSKLVVVKKKKLERLEHEIQSLKNEVMWAQKDASEKEQLCEKYRAMIVRAKEKMLAVLGRDHPEAMDFQTDKLPSDLHPEARFLRHLIQML